LFSGLEDDTVTGGQGRAKFSSNGYQRGKQESLECIERKRNKQTNERKVPRNDSGNDTNRFVKGVAEERRTDRNGLTC
jgi:hypothetical protein